jgi:hypothetical protein
LEIGNLFGELLKLLDRSRGGCYGFFEVN